MTRRTDPLEQRARELAIEDNVNPDSRVGAGRGMPAWCTFRDAARAEQNAAEAAALAVTLPPQSDNYANAPLTVLGTHDAATVQQMQNCMKIGNVVGGVICADGHLGYAQPVGGVIAYEDQVSISGVGFDIACGNMATRLDIPFSKVADRVGDITREIAKTISFGVGRVNDERVEHALFDDDELWRTADMVDYKPKARAQLGTVGSGNHYVDLMRDEEDNVWIGVHFGSRGLGHTSATKYLRAAGGKDGMHVPPAVVDTASELGWRYLAAMELAGRYAYAGRKWVCERVRQIVDPAAIVTDIVHNHHNYAWLELHGGNSGKPLYVVRKGATPAFPGQRGFVGGSMGDDAVIIRGLDTLRNRETFYSSIHGAGRLFGRKEAKRRFLRSEMDEWLRKRGVTLIGADLDESPMAYRRLPEVLASHGDTIAIEHTLRPFSVVMAGAGEHDPFKD